MQQLQQTASTRLLVDSTQDLDTWAAAVYWLGHDYTWELAASGLQAAAWVLPQYLPAQTDANEVVAYVHQSLRELSQRVLLTTFYDVEAAHTWLSRQG